MSDSAPIDRSQLVAAPYHLSNLGPVNVILGKNGSGKSRMMRRLDDEISRPPNLEGNVLYVTPERGGTLEYQPGVDQNMATNPMWAHLTRRANQMPQFRHQSASNFRRIELNLYREAEIRRQPADNSVRFAAIDALLENVELRREGNAFATYSRHDGVAIPSSDLSSGESELITLAIECFIFVLERIPAKRNVLLLDEPDVHLHPDLQRRFVDFLLSIVDEDVQVIIATHSTPIIAALSATSDARVAFVRPGQSRVRFEAVGDASRRLIPVFGAHPLTEVFMETVPLLVEGEDDARIWHQAVRSSRGSLALHPVVCDSVDSMADYESLVDRVAPSVYDAPRAYSLRDGDDAAEELEDGACVKRVRLACRESENLILCNEVLAACRISWERAKERMSAWIDRNLDHRYRDAMLSFQTAGFDRKQADVKDLRNILVGDILESNKPWEVLVGQVIAGAVQSPENEATEGSLRDFFGVKAYTTLIHPAAP